MNTKWCSEDQLQKAVDQVCERIDRRASLTELDEVERKVDKVIEATIPAINSQLSKLEVENERSSMKTFLDTRMVNMLLVIVASYGGPNDGRRVLSLLRACSFLARSETLNYS